MGGLRTRSIKALEALLEAQESLRFYSIPNPILPTKGYPSWPCRMFLRRYGTLYFKRYVLIRMSPDVGMPPQTGSLANLMTMNQSSSCLLEMTSEMYVQCPNCSDLSLHRCCTDQSHFVIHIQLDRNGTNFLTAKTSKTTKTKKKCMGPPLDSFGDCWTIETRVFDLLCMTSPLNAIHLKTRTIQKTTTCKWSPMISSIFLENSRLWKTSSKTKFSLSVTRSHVKLLILFCSFECYPRMTNSFVDALIGHPNSPKVYLLKGRGKIEPKGELSFVRGLSIEADLTATTRRPRGSFKPQILELRKTFSTYPNLEHLSVALHRLRSGCSPSFGAHKTWMKPLSLSSEEEFPPLRGLSLSGYQMEKDEIAIWKDKAPWHTLESLSLGPQSSEVFLKLATGIVQNLKHFKITAYSWAENPTKSQLDAFLSSFDTLESLTVKGRTPSSSAVANHRDLQYLCLHTIENGSGERETLIVEDIQRLDRQCQKLQTLKIDINPKDGWVG